MSRIWITQYALEKEGVIVVDVPDEELAAGPYLKLSRETLQPWRGKGVWLRHDIGDHWSRSEQEASVVIKKVIERRIRRAESDLKTAKKQLASFKANGIRLAKTLAEQKAERAARKPRRGK